MLSILFLILPGILAVPEDVVQSYMNEWGAHNLTGAYTLLHENVSFTWRGARSIFPTLGGEWIGKDQVSQYYSNVAQVFDPSQLLITDVVVLATEGEIVLIQYVELNTQLSSKERHVFDNTAIFTVQDNLIAKIEIFTDTSEVFAALSCDTPILYCGRNIPPLARFSDNRPPKPIPSALNSNVTLNKIAVQKYLNQLSQGNYQGAFTFLADNASLTWQGSPLNFRIGGTWSGKLQIEHFFGNVSMVFAIANFSFDEIKVLAGEKNTVLVQFREHNTALSTGRSYNEINTVIYTFGDAGVIEDIEVWLDTAAVLDTILCVSDSVKFSCRPYMPDNKAIVKDYLLSLNSSNLTHVYSLLADSAAMIYRVPETLLPTIGGVHLPREEIMRFYDNVDKLFDRSTFSLQNITVLASEDGHPFATAVVQYVEHRTAIHTRRSSQLVNTVVFYIFAHMEGMEEVANMVTMLDSATVYSTLMCADELLQCDGNKPLGSPRVSDKRPMKPLPSVGNSNVTLNKIAIEKYFNLLTERNIEGSLKLLSDSASLTFQGSASSMPTLAGTWAGIPRVREFHSNLAELFELHNISALLLAAEANVVVAQVSKWNTALRTNRTFYEEDIAVFTLGDAGVIMDLEWIIDTATILDSLLCKRSNPACVNTPSGSSGLPPSQVWIPWIVGVAAVLILSVGVLCFYSRYRRKASSDIHEGLLNENAGATLN